jgi:hypothetical protein
VAQAVDGAGGFPPRRLVSVRGVSSDDAGLAAVARVREALAPAPARTVGEPRGFSWWPHAHVLRVEAEPARADGAARVAVETALLGRVHGRGAEFAALARWNAREAALSSLRWDAERGEVSLRASAIARPGDAGAAARLLAHAALLQVGEALRAADALSIELPDASPLTPPAPGGLVPDPVAEVEAARAYASAAPAHAAMLEQAIVMLARLSPAPWVRATHAAHGFDAELEADPAHRAPAPHAARWLLRASVRQPHPRLGTGLLTALVPPPGLEPVAERVAATAALLNEGEAREWTGCDALGGWCVHAAAGLAHISFVPALALDDDTAVRLAWQAGTRARWAAAFLAHVEVSRAGRSTFGNPLSD